MQIRDRIVEFVRVPAAELVPNERNWRRHPAQQRAALRGILAEIGYADALLARRLADGRLGLIDGHLRAEETRDSVVPVLVVDLTEEEADKLLLSLDPLAAMATADKEALKALLASVRTEDAGLRAMLDGLQGDTTVPPEHPTLADRFGVPPFSVLNAREGWWQNRKRAWIALGIQSELGRGENLLGFSEPARDPRLYDDKRMLEAELGHPLTTGEAIAELERRGRRQRLTPGGGEGKNSAWMFKGPDGYKSRRQRPKS